MAQITNKTFDFLNLVTENNNREWFQANKHIYEASHEEMIEFAAELNQLMREHDNVIEMTGKKSLFRIYRDVRFSKNKDPYKNNWGGRLKRDTPFLRGGYYYQIQPGNSFIGAGFWNPSTPDIKLIRSQIAADPSEIEKINSEKTFAMTFGSLYGEKLKKAPKGFDAEHKAIEWLKHKSFLVNKRFTDKQVMHKDFVKEINETFIKVRPFFNYMSEILTTDLNGESLI